MDDYHRHLAPEFEESGAVKTSFENWWPQAIAEFPNVPEGVARYWLHEHWGGSTYGWLPSRQYRFALTNSKSDQLHWIRSRWCNFAQDNAECLNHGKYLVDLGRRTARYMLDKHDFPAPPIVLDNRDDHLPERQKLPAGFLLIEGHRRFNISLYLQWMGQFVETSQIWLMERVISQN